MDLIVSWPRNCDYPLWRDFLNRERRRFAKVLVSFTPHAGPDYSAFVRETVDAEFIDTDPLGDWRDVAVNAALDRSTAEWVWFTEQDFRILTPEFWPALTEGAYGWQEHDDRWHPSSLFVRRSWIDQTSRYFGPDPVDHFYRFGRELERLTPIQPLSGFSHMQGLSHNHFLIDTGQEAGLFKRDEFDAYLRECLGLSVPLHPGWVERAQRELER